MKSEIVALQALNKIIRSLANLEVTLGNITQALEKEVFQGGPFVQLYLQLKLYYTGNKKKSFASLFLCGACTATVKHAFTGTPFNHQSLPQEV